MLSKEKDMEIVGTCSCGEEAILACRAHSPELVLMDIRMPNMDGIQATRIIKKELNHIRVVMLTTFHDKENIQMALKVGADGYLLKTDKISNIAIKLRALFEGVAVIDSTALKSLTQVEINSFEKLTPREMDVFHLVAVGLTNKEIASHLFLSEGTVRNVLSSIMDKTGVNNRTKLSLLGRDNKDL